MICISKFQLNARIFIQAADFDPATQYKVKAGDTAFDIAQANGMSLDALKALNPGKNLETLAVWINYKFESELNQLKVYF